MAPPGARTITHRTLASRVSAADSRRRRRRRRRRHPCRAPLTDTERGLALGDGLEGVLDLEQLALGRERRERKVEGHFFETVVCCTIAENFLFCVWIQYIFLLIALVSVTFSKSRFFDFLDSSYNSYFYYLFMNSLLRVARSRTS